MARLKTQDEIDVWMAFGLLLVRGGIGFSPVRIGFCDVGANEQVLGMGAELKKGRQQAGGGHEASTALRAPSTAAAVPISNALRRI